MANVQSLEVCPIHLAPTIYCFFRYVRFAASCTPLIVLTLSVLRFGESSKVFLESTNGESQSKVREIV